MGPGAVDEYRLVLPAGRAVTCPCPDDDVFLGPRIKEVAPRFSVPVPEHFTPSRPPNGATNDAIHHGESRRVEPNDGVRPWPDDVGNTMAGVVAIDHPSGLEGEFFHPFPESVVRQRSPVRLVVDRVQFQMRSVENFGNTAGNSGLARPGAANHRHTIHVFSVTPAAPIESRLPSSSYRGGERAG